VLTSRAEIFQISQNNQSINPLATLGYYVITGELIPNQRVVLTILLVNGIKTLGILESRREPQFQANCESHIPLGYSASHTDMSSRVGGIRTEYSQTQAARS
jgi:hypothetical protein